MDDAKTTDNNTSAPELAYGQIWQPTLADITLTSRVVESVLDPTKVAFTLRSRSGVPLADPRAVISRDEWNEWVKSNEAELSSMTHACLKRIILHELGHLVVDLVLTGYIGVLTIENTSDGYNAFVKLTDIAIEERNSKRNPEDLISYCASAYGGWVAVKVGIEKQIDNSLRTSGDIVAGFEGFTGADSLIISTVKKQHGGVLPADLERVAFERAKTVITAHFDLIWEVTQRLEKEVNTQFHSENDTIFNYSQDKAYLDFSSLIT